TGVTGSPRVRAEPGGDFVANTGDGMSDCDAHGTLTASIIAGRPAPTDAFVGVAPDARILSLRQTSDAFQPVGSRQDPNDPNTTRTAGSLRSLARAIVHAANIGAQVINISEAACHRRRGATTGSPACGPAYSVRPPWRRPRGADPRTRSGCPGR